MTQNGLVAIIVVVLIISGLNISNAFATNQTENKTRETINPLFDSPFVVITIVGVLSLTISLIVFSVGTNLRTRPLNKGFTIGEIFTNLGDLKRKVGEPSFTNLINGLSSAAKEELVFPEPIGVLRHKEFRRALTISVTLVYFVVVGYSTLDPAQSADFKDNPVIQSLAWVFVAVMAFYFGDKIFENYAKNKGVQLTANIFEPITIEEAKISKDGEKLTIKIKNNLKSKIEVTEILIDDEPVDISDKFEIEGEKSESKDFKIKKGGKIIKVKVGSVMVERETETQ